MYLLCDYLRMHCTGVVHVEADAARHAWHSTSKQARDTRALSFSLFAGVSARRLTAPPEALWLLMYMSWQFSKKKKHAKDFATKSQTTLALDSGATRLRRPFEPRGADPHAGCALTRVRRSARLLKPRLCFGSPGAQVSP